MRLIALFLLGCWLNSASASFHEAELIQTSRRAQFHGVRTNWHDLLGRNCPRFGVDALTAVQLPHPKAFGVADSYKVQLAFDGDRVLTAWLKLIGKGAPEVPLLDVALTRSGTALVSVQYRWEHTPGVDAAAALYLALVVGLGAFVAVTAGVLASYDSKLRAFMADLAGEDGLVVPGKDE